MLKRYTQQNNIKVDLEIKTDDSNEINSYVFESIGNEIIDMCLIQCQKDIKLGTITSVGKIKQELILEVTNYLLNVLNMESVFVRVGKNNKKIIKYLEDNSFESLGTEEDETMFLKEKKPEIIKQRAI
jgi:hypothetical protein